MVYMIYASDPSFRRIRFWGSVSRHDSMVRYLLNHSSVALREWVVHRVSKYCAPDVEYRFHVSFPAKSVHLVDMLYYNSDVVNYHLGGKA